MAKRDKIYISLEKQSKKARKKYNAALRTVIPFNTGTRVHKTDKHPSRARAKKIAQKEPLE